MSYQYPYYTAANDYGRAIKAVSDWIDDHPANAARDSEARTWGRLAKVSEECGEVISAYIGVTGQNPRKGVVGDKRDVSKELLDVAITALTAYAHLEQSEDSVYALFNHVMERMERVGLVFQRDL